MRRWTFPAAERAVRWRGWLLALLLLLLGAVASAAFAGQPSRWRWTTDQRVVAVGDVHGAYASLVAVLAASDLISADGHWSGGQAHLVMLGDMIDRGPRSRDVLDLVMRLQSEARASGGWVHVVLGNHEVMNLVGDLRYVVDSDWAAFARDERPHERDRFIRRRLRQTAGENDNVEERRAALAKALPVGFLARARAFAPDGRYGRWLLQQPILVKVNDVVFVHGGLPEVLLRIDPDRINQVARGQVEAFLQAQYRLRQMGRIGLEMSFGEQLEWARDLVVEKGQGSSKTAELAWTMLAAAQGLSMDARGPLWYRGTSLDPAGEEGSTVAAVLDHLGAKRAVLGHTPTHTGRVSTRFDGTVVRADTGMLTSHYGGHASAVVIEGGQVMALYPGEAAVPLASRRWELAVGSFVGAEDVEEFLSTAAIVSVEEVGTGSTRPLRVMLSEDGRRGEAVFKTVEAEIPCRSGQATSPCRDSFAHEVAAYRLDRLLGLGMVPPTVVREIDGKVGSLQLWVGGAINENNRQDEDLQPPHPDDFAHQLDRVRLFDRMILNPNRNGSGILITTRDWKIHLIDHSQAFQTGDPDGVTDVGGATVIDDELARRLRSLRPAELRDQLGELLTEGELEALLSRLEALRSL